MNPQRRTALVTGGARGIGRAVAGRLAADGYGVALVDVDAGAGRAAAREIGRLAKGEAVFLRADVAVEAEVVAAVEGTVGRFGRLDLLVNNAGINCHKPLAKLGLEDWNRVIGANLTGAFLFAKHAAAHLKAAHGAIVNVASTRALMSEPDTEAYAASKGGIVALTHALAVSLGPDVRVNCISPGWIDVSATHPGGQIPLSTEDHTQHPAGRVGHPEDVAEAVLFLAGAGFVTGANLVVDGGMTRKMIYV
ncbi:MAG: SDR family oxidoreductase [Rhodospirillales bacterium]|jgi:NAD(P)-dependent dehydrogenase (short-subunit alcohol dehydrogenase family)|nr:SDR family oxidoreductase [Rhodospirillales bacterium]